MTSEYCCKRRVEFGETDMAGIVHFSNFFRYMEMTEHQFFRELGLSIHAEVEGRTVGWPRIRAECEYLAPLRFEEEFDVRLIVREKRRKSISYEFQFLKADGTLAARGSMTTVCTTIDPTTGRMQSIPIPKTVHRRIEASCAAPTPSAACLHEEGV